MRTVNRSEKMARHALANVRLALAHLVPLLVILMTAAPTLAHHGRGGVFLSLSDGRETVPSGGSLVYVISIRNMDGGFRDVDVRMRLPQYTNFIAASNNGMQVGNEVRWENVALSENAVRTLTVNVSVNPYAPMDQLLTAEVEVEGERALDSTRILERATVSPLSITVTDGRETVEPKEELDYRIRVKNVGDEYRAYTLRANMSEDANFVSATGEHFRRNGTIEWKSKELAPGASEEYGVTVRVDDDAVGFYALRLSVSANGAGERATDLTYVHQGPLEQDFDLSVKSDTITAAPGDEITYTITLENESAILATNVHVTNALPSYTEYVDSTEGGLFVGGGEVRWDDITVSPNGKRVLMVTTRVRRDAPGGFQLVNSAFVKNHRAFTSVEVGPRSLAKRGEAGSQKVLLRKTADRSEVRPGDTVRYTVYIRNTTERVLRNLEVKDRFDDRYLSLADDAQDALWNGSEMQWIIPELQPGEVWQRNYSLLVGNDVPQGVSLQNVVSVGGADIAILSLTERVQTTDVAVFKKLPPTGAGMDGIFVSLSGLLGMGQLYIQRRKMLGM